MVAGHFGFAAGVKAAERRAPLWALMLATAWLDVLFAPLYAAGIETLASVPGTLGGYGDVIIHADYTHSLVGAAIIAVVFGVVAAIPWGRRVGAVLGGVVFSHWLLDLVVHRGDMSILPGDVGGLPRVGFGLWREPVASIAVELALVTVGSYLYWRAAVKTAGAAGDPRRERANLLGGLVFAAGVAVLALDAFTG
ncbi:MAG TPA: permease [Actinomycetota bacterium]|nr:permease [Actinomycetota bacterium]